MKASDIYTPDEIQSALEKWTEGKHSPLGPSSIFRVKRCPASALGSIIYRDADSGSIHADKGTRIHSAIETYIQTGQEPDSDSEEAQHLEVAKTAMGSAKWEAEVKVQVDYLYFGRADAISFRKQAASIIDWKTGAQAEMCEESQYSQLKHLAMALMSMYPHISCVNAKAVYTGEGTESDVFFFDREEVSDYIKEIEKLSDECYSGDAEFSTCTGDWCKYCKVDAAGKCPTKAAELLEATIGLGLTLPETETALTIDKADDMLLKVKIVKKALEKMEEEAKAVIKENGGSKSFVVVNSKGKTKTDWESLAKDLCQFYGYEEIDKEFIDNHTTTSEPTTSIRERKRK